MKKLFVIVFVLLMGDVSYSQCQGDVNQDNDLNVSDIIIVVNHILGFDTLAEDLQLVADYNSNLSIDVSDVILIVNDILNENLCSSELLDIITWNIENFPKSELTIDYVSSIINSFNDIDIIALQEIQSTIAFNQLISSLEDGWVGYRHEDSNYGELSYLINTEKITFNAPYSILNQEEYYFAYRPPYVLEFTYKNKQFVLINIHYKCCDNTSQDSYRREQASILLDEYIVDNFNTKNVIVAGDFNDELIDDDNVFDIFLNDSQNYLFADLEVALQSDWWQYWSYPTWPSHIDHILITNELFDEYQKPASYCSTFLIDSNFSNWWEYDQYISDHRPVRISLFID